MIPVTVALVDESGTIDHASLVEVAGALNEQVNADLRSAWRDVPRAVVLPYAKGQEGPHQWKLIGRAKLDEPGALGYHTNRANGQPVSYFQVGRDWTTTASHEALEMLGDPYGRRLHQARLPEGLAHTHASFGLKHPTSRVSYLVELCDPPEATAYEVGGVPVSDFVLPTWYRSSLSASARSYSHAGACPRPRVVADGGYVSFANPTTDEWYQVFVSRGRVSIRSLGRFDANDHQSLREWTDAVARAARADGL